MAILSQPPAAVVESVSDRSETSSMRWLILGDGDFSFSLSIATACGGCVSPASFTAANGKGASLLLVASSLDSQEVLALKYGPGVLETLAKLRALGVLVIHGVDATRLLPTLKRQLAENGGSSGSDWMGDGFDRVTFQFPLCGATLSKAEFEAAAVPAELRNRHLIAETLCGSALVLKPEGELIISAKADNKYDMRFFCKHPRESGPSTPSQSAATLLADPRDNDMPPPLVYATQWLFDISQYPGYTPRNVETNESFPIANSVSFAFVHQGRLNALGLINRSNFSGSPSYERGEGNTDGASKPSCELCGIVCSGQSAFDAHIKGTKHRRNAALERKWQAFWSKRQQLDEDGEESEGATNANC